MKRTITFLFVALLAMVNVQIWASPADMGTKAMTGIVSVGLMNLVVPMKYFNFSSLNAVTEVSIFHSYIVEKILQTVAFLTKSRDVSSKVLGGAVVYIPQAGNNAQVIKNNNTWPMVARRRVDSDITYALEAYSTEPTHIPWQELQAISYNKLDSVIGGDMNELVQAVADDMLVKWAPMIAGKQVATTGTAQGPVGAQTGNRKGLIAKDLSTLMNLFNVDRVPQDNRQLLIDDNMYQFLYDSLTDAQMNAFNQFADNRTGQVGKLHSFNIFTRTGVAYAAASPTVKAFGAVVSGTDNLACMAWHPDFVERAIGDTKLFTDKDNPLYQGDLYSSIVRAGGRKVRADNKGVYAIVQAASA